MDLLNMVKMDWGHPGRNNAGFGAKQTNAEYDSTVTIVPDAVFFLIIYLAHTLLARNSLGTCMVSQFI